MAYLSAILVFLGLSVIRPDEHDRQTDRQTSDAHHRLMPPPYGGWDITIFKSQRESKMKLTEPERVRAVSMLWL